MDVFFPPYFSFLLCSGEKVRLYLAAKYISCIACIACSYPPTAHPGLAAWLCWRWHWNNIWLSRDTTSHYKLTRMT